VNPPRIAVLRAVEVPLGSHRIVTSQYGSTTLYQISDHIQPLFLLK
jgi:hypothetical protein